MARSYCRRVCGTGDTVLPAVQYLEAPVSLGDRKWLILLGVREKRWRQVLADKTEKSSWKTLVAKTKD